MEIVTKDLYLAAILVSYECSIVSTDRSDPKRQYFYFNNLPPQVYVRGPTGHPVLTDVSTFEEIKSFYLSKKLFLLPSFVDCLRSVKSNIYSTE